jgi:amino acid transporter
VKTRALDQSTSQVGQLKKNALSVVDVVAMGTAVYAPTAALYYNTPLGASFAGASVPFTFLVATVAILIVTFCMSELAKHMASAGGYYAWVRGALGQRAGFMVGWLVLLGPFMILPGVYAGVGNYVSTILSRYGLNLSWLIVSVLLLVLVTVINVLGIKLSVRTGLVILAVELTIVTLFCLFLVARGGDSGNTLKPFNPSGLSLGAIGGGMVFGILSFIGYESVTTVGEESSRARAAIPVALFVGVIVGGIFLTFGSYAATIGFGVQHVDKLAANPAPFDTLSQRYGNGVVRAALDVAGVTSFVASLILVTVAVTRIYYAMARDRLIPSVLGTLSSRYKTPTVAIGVQAVLSLIVFGVLGLWVGPLNTYGYLGSILTFAVAPVYVLIMVSVMVVFLRTFRSDFNPILHIVLPIIGILVIAYPVWSLTPLGGPQSPPYNYLPLLVLAYGLIGFALSFVLGGRLDSAERAIARVTFEEGS